LFIAYSKFFQRILFFLLHSQFFLRSCKMALPLALINDGNIVVAKTPTPKSSFKSSVLHRSLHSSPPVVQSANGLYITLKHASGRTQNLLDATGGAAVSCIGHGNGRVKAAITKQMDEVSYAHSLFFATNAGEELGKELMRGTEGKMGACFIVSSGGLSLASRALSKLTYPEQRRRITNTHYRF
jgi:adenosylmethionine-8-amino-7-oxononanoate aminotransferase